MARVGFASPGCPNALVESECNLAQRRVEDYQNEILSADTCDLHGRIAHII